MKNAKRNSFKYRIFGSNLIVALLPLVLCNLLMLNVFTNTLNSQGQQAGLQQLQNLAQQLSATLQDTDEALQSLANNSIVQKALLDHTTDAFAKDVYLELYQATNGVGSGAAFALYDAGGQLQFTTQESVQEPQLQVYWGVLRKAAQAGGTVYLPQPENAASLDSLCLRAAHEVLADNGSRIGYMVCNITVQQMRQIFSGLFSDTSTMFLFTPQGHLMYASRSGMDAEIDMLRRCLIDGGQPAQEDVRYFFHTDEASGCIVALRQPAALSSGEVGLMRSISLLAAAVSLILCILISFLLSRSLSSPIERLSAAMHRVRTGNLTTRVAVERQDEIGQLTEDFNAMTAQLQAHLNEEVQHQKDLNDARIRQLQAQLNPHFLYNTLDTMKWLAKIHQLPEVARLAGSLGGILRSSIASEQFITLRQELALVEHYIDIQKIRFAGKFEYVIDVPEPLMEMVVPKLILQPLVENSILHGLETSDNGYVYIYGRCEQGELTIAVTDDGCGMPPAMVERLNSNEPKMLEGHLGLYNVGRILQLYYGTGYGLHATSQEGIGTTVTVCIPATKEDNHA